MDIEFFREYCLSKPHVIEDFPFDEKVLVFKVAGKIFTLTDIEDFTEFNVKCDPEKAQELREKYTAVKPGYHMNKKHWNTISIFEDADTNLLLEWIDDSYNLVVSSLPKKTRENLDLPIS